MDNKLIMSILIFLLMLSLVPASFADDDREYYINGADIDVYVLENGLLHIKETFAYEFEGEWNGIYRDIPLVTGTGKYTSIENLKTIAKGAYPYRTEVSMNGDTEHIKIYLSSDPAKQVKIKNRKVNVTLEYDFINQTNIYNDIAEVHYKPWGDGWEKKVPKVTARFHLQSQKGVEYWINPSYFKGDDSWNGNTLTVETTAINPGEWFELRILIPKNQFDSNAPYANNIHQDGKSKIEQIQKDEAAREAWQNKLYTLLSIAFFVSLIIPFLIYFLLGREPKIEYDGEYERELPTDDSPAVVNALTSVGITGVGTPDMNGFKATVMDLINRGYFKLEQASVENDTILQFSDKNPNDLGKSEKIIYNLFKRYSYNGEFSLNDFSDRMLNESNAIDYRSAYSNWVGSVENNDIGNNNSEKMFIGTGNILIAIYAVLGVLVAGLFFFVTMNNSLPAANTLFWASIVFGIICIACLIMCFIFPSIGGRWTKEGRTYNAKWNNFKKYLTDFSMIKEYPPESVTIWNHYLVYATALGVADEVIKNMKMSVPPEELTHNDLYRFHSYGGYAILSTSMNHGATTGTTSSSGGGFGGSGGGGGGGGGGAF